MKLASALAAAFFGVGLPTSVANAAQVTQHVVICEYRKGFSFRTESGYASDGPSIVGVFPQGSTDKIFITTEPGRTKSDAIVQDRRVIGVKVSSEYFDFIERYLAKTRPAVADTIITDDFVGFTLSPGGPADKCP